MKEFSFKQIVILVLMIITTIAFLETSASIPTADFWSEFLLNVLVYVGTSVLAIILLTSFSKNQ